MATTWKIPKKYAFYDEYKQANPYGTLGPSPQRVANINKAMGITPISAPAISTAMPTYQEPNWAALIAGDPEYGAAQSAFNRQNQMDRGSLRDAIRRAVIESGLNVGQDEDIDAGTIAAAQANQYSSAADIANQLRRGTAMSDAELAARGALSSGQFTENRGQIQRGADQARNTLQSNLLDTIASGRNAYTSAVADRENQLINLRSSIAARLAQNPGLFMAQQAGAAPAAVAGRPTTPATVARPAAPRYAEGTLDGAGHVFRNGRWVPLGGGGQQTPDWLRALQIRSAGMNRRYGL